MGITTLLDQELKCHVTDEMSALIRKLRAMNNNE